MDANKKTSADYKRLILRPSSSSGVLTGSTSSATKTRSSNRIASANKKQPTAKPKAPDRDDKRLISSSKKANGPLGSKFTAHQDQF